MFRITEYILISYYGNLSSWDVNFQSMYFQDYEIKILHSCHKTKAFVWEKSFGPQSFALGILSKTTLISQLRELAD